MPAAVVGDGQPGGAVDLVRASTVTVDGGVTFGVVEQVLHGAAELVAVTDDLRSRDPPLVSTDHSAAVAQPARLAQHDVVEIDRCRRHVGGAGVAAGELEEVVDQVLRGRSPRRGRCARSSRGSASSAAGEIDLELAADPRQRAAQLVRCVGDEALLTANGVFEAVEGLVHGAGEPVDLVAGRRVRATRRPRFVPLISAISARIFSTGRSVRPVSHHVSSGQGAAPRRER